MAELCNNYVNWPIADHHFDLICHLVISLLQTRKYETPPNPEQNIACGLQVDELFFGNAVAATPFRFFGVRWL
jgi:hypothetical protein